MCVCKQKTKRERGREERPNERTNDFILFLFFIHEGNGISTILFFFPIQPSGKTTTTTKTRKIKRGGEREGGRGRGITFACQVKDHVAPARVRWLIETPK